MPDHTLALTNGAALTARNVLTTGLSSIDDIFAGGSLSLKLKAAKRVPPPNPDEKQTDYDARIEAWSEASFGDIEVTEPERDALKTAIKALSEKKTLQSNEFVCELIAQLGLAKS